MYSVLGVQSLVGNSLNGKSAYTVEHMSRVSNKMHNVFSHIYNCFNIDPDLHFHYSTGAGVHDIGKIAVHSSILNGNRPLTPEEKKLMEQHVTVGANMLSNRHSKGPNNIYYNMALYHQEHWDGSGYPFGLVNSHIPFEARLVSVFDAFDALSHERPYKPAIPKDQVLEMIVEQKEKFFDPKVVDFFVGLYNKNLV